MAAYGGLLLLTVAAAVGGIITLIPNAAASYPNVLGYRSVCTFAPAATLFCFAVAGTSCVLRASLVKRKGMTGKASFRAPAVAVVGLILVLGVVSTVWYLSVKSAYVGPDATTQATPET